VTPLLDVAALTVRFGGKVAVDGLDMAIEAGQLVGLIGPNGAGKTTTIDAITGFVACEGSLSFGGVALSGSAQGQKEKRAVTPTARARLGLARTWQGAELFDDLSVLEHLQLAGERTPMSDLDEILAGLNIEQFAEASVQSLSHGQRKLVGVARALASKPRLVCMDEPAAGLDTAESQQLGRRIRQITADGTGVLLVDHDMGLVLSICDYLYVLDFGKLIAQGTPSEIRNNDIVIEAYLGRRSKQDDPVEAPE
jgi:branched-chain amino acid transport system ATP-binding protein